MNWKGWQQLRQNKKNGISMVVVICVSAFFVAFAAAILYTAGLLTAQSNLRLKEERCNQLATSAAKVLNEELVKYDNRSNDATQDNTFYAFANKFLDNSQYLDYSEDYPDSSKYNFLVSDTNLDNLAEAASLPAGYGNIRITLSKEKNSAEDLDSIKTGKIDVASTGTNYQTEIDRIRNITVREYNLIVEVTASYDDATYTCTTEYSREEKYDVKFSHKGTDIVWDGENWHKNNTSGEIYTPDDSECIVYEFLTQTPTYCVFRENTYVDTTQGGGTDSE